ncbi:GNAT family N-acetyltransferase [Guptibacillus hwajinpoensis]|uniref:GNAT family N-acetyltransferase n=1 Tax=Guptibacillus hwajinpoensis TaxID=208199 RepID=UPI0037352C3C
MYIRKRISKKDDSALISIVLENFEVSANRIQGVLDQSREVLIVCHDDGKIAGFICYRFKINQLILIDYLVLDQNYQGKGITRSLQPAFEDFLVQQEIYFIYALVDEENKQGIESLKKLGFETVYKINSNFIIRKHLKRKVSDSLSVRRLTAPRRLSNR